MRFVIRFAGPGSAAAAVRVGLADPAAVAVVIARSVRRRTTEIR